MNMKQLADNLLKQNEWLIKGRGWGGGFGMQDESVPVRWQRLVKLYKYTCNICNIYRVSQEERTKLREGVPYVTLYRCNPKKLYPNLNGYGDNGQRNLKLWQLLLTYWLPNTYWNWQEYVVYIMLISVLNIKVTCKWHKAIKLNYKNSHTNIRCCL